MMVDRTSNMGTESVIDNMNGFSQRKINFIFLSVKKLLCFFMPGYFSHMQVLGSHIFEAALGEF